MPSELDFPFQSGAGGHSHPSNPRQPLPGALGDRLPAHEHGRDPTGSDQRKHHLEGLLWLGECTTDRQHVASGQPCISTCLLCGSDDDLAIELEDTNDLFQERRPPLTRLEQPPFPFGCDGERDPRKPGSAPHIDTGTREKLIYQGHQPKGVLDMAFLETLEVSG